MKLTLAILALLLPGCVGAFTLTESISLIPPAASISQRWDAPAPPSPPVVVKVETREP